MLPQKLNPATSIQGLGSATVADFWSWAFSDILSNTTRGVFAEFRVSVALDSASEPRAEWEPHDVTFGGHRVEVKSAAYCQSWPQRRPSPIKFDIARRRVLSPQDNILGQDVARHCEIYVFCLFAQQDRATARRTLLDVDAWRFYVVGTAEIDRRFPDRKSLGLGALERFARHVCFRDLRQAVESAIEACHNDREGTA